MSKSGNQIFVSIFKGENWPPSTLDVRCGYDEKIVDLKSLINKKSGVENLQLFWRGEELNERFDEMQLLDLDMHTGICLKGYDLSETPHYWPPVKHTPEGLKFVKPNEI
eukprot:TRINITY_DN18009_c0_g1_i1.p2 TRINITY_DN18009_c0_g1~~TRINITY_DN18009_c0_g1_i1.p2  ORF type:complete len:124 (-),score=21.56 TRINITY_DN18009_c0_g1_i1:314-640(-)